MSSWHITGFRDIVTLRRITQCCRGPVIMGGPWIISGCSLQMAGAGNPESDVTTWVPGLMQWGFCSQCARLSSSWSGSLLSCQSWCFSKLCYKQSHIPMIYLLFVPIILEFKRRRHTDKQEPNDPFVWELRDACIPPGQPGLALNKRLNLHIINDNGIHTAWDTDDQEMSGAPCVPVLSYQRVIYLCLLILTNAPGIRCTSVALQSPAPSPLVTSGPGQKSAACLQCYSPHCTPGVQVYTHAYGQSWNQNIGM